MQKVVSCPGPLVDPSLLCRLAGVLTLAGALLVCGCGPSADEDIDTVFNPCETIVVAPAEGTTADELDTLDRALQMWNERAGLRLSRTAPADAQRRQALGAGEQVIPLEFEPSIPLSFGLYRDEVGTVWVNSALDDRGLTITIVHELGHAFGLPHVDGRRSVMNEGNLDTPLTDRDVEALMAKWDGCRPAEATSSE